MDVDELGRPRCIGGQLMVPVVQGPGGSWVFKCPTDGCPKRKGKPWIRCDDVVSMSPQDDYRLFCAIPRWHPEWTRLYGQRTSVERVFSRLKGSRGLAHHQYRGLARVQAHCLLAVLTLQLKALAQVKKGGRLRECLRKVA